jgi:hypothetical protein
LGRVNAVTGKTEQCEMCVKNEGTQKRSTGIKVEVIKI